MFDDRQQLTEVLALLIGFDERVVAQSALELVQNHERIDAAGELLVDERVGNLVLNVAGRNTVHAFA